MDILLNKYYEYLNQLILKCGESLNYEELFNCFYERVVDYYHLETLKDDYITPGKDAQLSKDIWEFFEFYNSKYHEGTYSLKDDSYAIRIRKMMKLPIDDEFLEKRKQTEEHLSQSLFETSKASFKWFRPTKYMFRDMKDSFLISNSNSSNTYCKIYLSIKPDNYVDVMIKLQTYIDQFIENHKDEEYGQCKFRKKIANDSIVMRFACKEHYDEFMEYLRNNPDITDSFNTPNSFMPQNDLGVCVIPDNGGSYNYFVTKMIFDYILECKRNNKETSIDEISEFISNYDCSHDKMLSENGDKIINDFKSILIGKLQSKSDDELLSVVFGEQSKSLKLTNKNN